MRSTIGEAKKRVHYFEKPPKAAKNLEKSPKSACRALVGHSTMPGRHSYSGRLLCTIVLHFGGVWRPSDRILTTKSCFMVSETVSGEPRGFRKITEITKISVLGSRVTFYDAPMMPILSQIIIRDSTTLCCSLAITRPFFTHKNHDFTVSGTVFREPGVSVKLRKPQALETQSSRP